MKRTVFFVLSFSLLSLNASAAEFWTDARALVAACAVQPYAVNAAGHKIYGALKSVCPEILRRDDVRVTFVLNGESFDAVLTDSLYADGGDLGDLRVVDASGAVVANRANIPAFGDPLLALAGNADGVREELDSSLLSQ